MHDRYDGNSGRKSTKLFRIARIGEAVTSAVTQLVTDCVTDEDLVSAVVAKLIATGIAIRAAIRRLPKAHSSPRAYRQAVFSFALNHGRLARYKQFLA